MKPRIFTSVVLFISGYAPLFCILAIKDIDFECTHRLRHPLVVWWMLGIVALCVGLLFVIMASIKRGVLVKVTGVKNRSVDIINYTIPYVVSFIGVDLSKPADWLSLAVFLGIMMLLTITSKSIFIDPVLSLAGYGLYDLDYSRDGMPGSTTILCRRDLRRGENCTMRSLTPYLYIITSEAKAPQP